MKSKPTIFKTVIFVRHGQYLQGPERLTPLGRRQARLTANRIKAFRPSKLFSSTMPRAKETADIIASHIKLKTRKKAFFREGVLPGSASFSKRAGKEFSTLKKRKLLVKIKNSERRVLQAFEFLFRPPRAGQSCEVVVAHGNVIRHWVCQALKIRAATKWRSMDVLHASLTSIRIDNNGNIVLLGFSDCGHLPHEMRSYV